ncbi:hypothetical protein JCM10450v2_004427 [Rhodotorula kratochvilovae]
MSGQGQGYSRGPPPPQHPQPNPYGNPSPDDPQAAFYSSLPPQHQQQGGAPYADHNHKLSTVSERDENISSPEMGRNDPHFGGNPAGYDPYAQQHHHHQQQQYDYTQQEGYDQGAYAQYDQGAAAEQQHEQHDQPPQEQFDAPYYPGWVYNPATNSYDPDPSYQPEGAGAEDAGQAYGAQDAAAGQQEQYGAYGQDSYGAADSQAQADPYGASNDPYGQQQQQQQQAAPAAPAGQDQEDPYANDPYAADPYADDGYNAYANDGYDTFAQQPQPQGQSHAAAEDFGAPTAQHAEAHDPYAADSNPYAEEEEQADPFAQQDAQADPFAPQQQQQDGQDPYGAAPNGEYDPYGASSGGQQDPYALSPGAQQDPYGTSSGGQQDPYAAPQDPYGPQDGAQDQYAPPQQQQRQQQRDPYQAYEQPPAQQQQPPAVHEQPQQQQAYDPYAPAGSRSAASPPPARNAYSPPPSQQQYASFAAFGQSAESAAAPYDPYAPHGGAPQQQQTQPQQDAHDPYAPRRSGGRAQPPQQQQAFDPYAAQRQAASPPTQQQQLPPAPRQAPPPERSVASPPTRTAALSPPPRSSSAASNSSSRAPPPAAAAPPPRATPAAAPPKRGVPPPIHATPARAQVEPAAPSPRQTTPSQMASPRAEAAAALASPPPRSRPLPVQAQAQPKQSSGAAFDIPPPRNAPPARAQPPKQREQYEAPPPATAQPPPQQQQQQQQQEPRRPPPQRKPVPAVEPASAPSPYAAPPPAQPQRARGTSGSSTGSATSSGSVLRPPVARAAHQRGASAFGSDSPYGALPSGPLMSSYEPPAIKEEEEEDEVPPPPQQEEQSQEMEDHVPSWMQATAAPPAARSPFYPKSEPEETVVPKQEEDLSASRGFRQERQQPPPPSARRQEPADLADVMGQMSLGDQQQQQQGPPPPRAGGAPPPSRQQGGAPPPRAGAAPPPRGAPPPAAKAPQAAGGAPPPTRGGPPPRGQPPQQQQPPQARAPPQQQQRAPPPQQQQQRGAPPPRPSQLPMSPDRGQVPQLHFEAPSPDVRPERRIDPYGYASGRASPMPMAGIEETPEPSEHEDYFGGAAASEDQAMQQAGGDDSIVYHPQVEDDRATGPTTPSSQYGGEWQADSENTQGYDYLSSHPVQQQQQQQQQRPYDPYAPPPHQQQNPYAPAPPTQQNPYAPRHVPSRESTFTPPAPQRGPTTYAASPRKPNAPLQPPTASAMMRANSYDAPPSRPVDSYSPYAQPPPPQQQQQQQQPYNPYAAQQAPPVSRPASSMAGPSADLGLERCTAPIATFGFGGKLVLVFPSGGRPSYGMDSANPYGVSAPQAQQSTPTTVHIRKLADAAAPATSDGAPTFPGPIFLDGGKANAGKKRKEAVAWLAQRIAELEQEAGYARGAAPPGFAAGDAGEKRRKVETRLLLVKLVRIMIENEGKLVGSPAVDDAVHALFAPADADESGALPTADQLAAAASQGASGSSAPFVNYGVSASNLDDMTKFLLRGERREAVAYALDNKMWAHAFIIASCVDTDCWKDVTNEFLRSELTPEGAGPGAEGREALRVAYGMFAGLGAESIHQFIPPRSLGPPTPGLLPPAPIGNGAASSPLSRVPSESAHLPENTLEKWQDTVGMIVANRTAGDSGALTSLGDALNANGWTDAAHICYLLSPQTSLAMGLGLPGSRITLLGSNPTAADHGIDLESIQLTELVEFALSLVPTIKGHEPFVGFPHLQAFRLYHAAALADAGHTAQAHKYTEAIVNTLKLATKPSPFYHPRLVAQIKALSERLSASPGAKEGGSWITRKVPRPTVNSLWSTFEGGFNKFVAGDDEPNAQQLAAKAEVQKATNGQAVGAFSHFSSISPGSTSGTLSRAQSSTDLASANLLHAVPPARPLSAQRPVSPLAAPPHQQHQSPSQHQSPGPPPVKRAPFKTHHARSSSLGAFAGYDYNPTAPPPWQSYTPPTLKRGPNGETPEGPRIAEGGFTASPQQERDAPRSARRPQFAAVDEQLREDESGFISPMAHLTPSVSPAPPASRAQQTHRRMTTAEELADLGIANNKSKKPAFDTLDEELEAEEGGVTPTREEPGESSAAGPSASSAQSKELKPTSGENEKPTIKPSKSWLGGWFKREASPAATGPGPIRANLGEQKSLYYDEKLKRWINKGDKIEAPPAVVPPPRAATASPSKTMRNGSPRFGGDVPPVPPMPPRSATTGPPPLSRSATSADLRGDSRPPSSAGMPTRPPSATGFPPRSGGATPVDGAPARAGPRKNKPRYVVVKP